MEFFLVLWHRLRALATSNKRDAELDEELRTHIALATEENLQRGMNADEARRRALIELGGFTQTRENYRMQRSFGWLEELMRDLRYAARQLMRNRGFSATAVLTLALALGASTAIFSLLNVLLLRPLPVARPEELAILRIDHKSLPSRESFCEPLFRAIARRHDLFAQTFAFTQHDFLIRGNAGSVDAQGELVSGSFFSALGARPLLGRVLTEADDQRGGGPGGYAVVLSEAFWKSWFHGAPDVVGRTLTIANARFTVVGVMPARFIGANPTERPQLYAPLWTEPLIDAPYNNIEYGTSSWWLTVMARRQGNVSLAQINAALESSSHNILRSVLPADQIAHFYDNAHLHAIDGAQGYSYLQSQYRKPLLLLFWMCAALLLLACANLACLQMARATARERELATRLALGATRVRLVRQLMAENLLLATFGTLAGVAIAPFAGQLLASILLGVNDSTSVIDTAPDLHILLFAAAMITAVSLLIGLLPSLRATAHQLAQQINGGAQTMTQSRASRLIPRLLLGLEIALALLLVTSAGLLATSLARVYRTGIGFDPHQVACIDLNTSKQNREGADLLRWYQNYGERLQHLPGVRAVSFNAVTPLSGSTWSWDYMLPAWQSSRTLDRNEVAPAYFATLRIPLLRGREFTWNDTPASGGKVILSESAARLFFPNEDAIGKQIYTNAEVVDNKISQHPNIPLEVIGIVGDIRSESMQTSAPATVYQAIKQSKEKKQSYTALVRFDGAAAPLAHAARQLVAQTAPDVPAPVFHSMNEILNSTIATERLMALLAAFFAASALLIVGIGLYGTLSYTATQRRAEIGIRMALGAQRRQVVLLVCRENIGASCCGLLLGVALALAATRLLASLLYNTSTHDPWILFAAVMLLWIASALASTVPALRVARIDPAQTLRAE